MTKPNEQLSRNFSLAELCASDTAVKYGLDNSPTPTHLDNMRRYLVPGLEQVRSICGNRSITVTSAYRNPVVNKKVGGTDTSAHPMGFAADIRVSGLSALAVARLIDKAMKDKLVKVDQLILESGRSVVHVSFDPRARMQAGHQPGAAGTAIDWRYFR